MVAAEAGLEAWPVSFSSPSPAPQLLSVHLGKLVEPECPAVVRAAKCHIAPLGLEGVLLVLIVRRRLGIPEGEGGGREGHETGGKQSGRAEGHGEEMDSMLPSPSSCPRSPLGFKTSRLPGSNTLSFSHIHNPPLSPLVLALLLLLLLVGQHRVCLADVLFRLEGGDHHVGVAHDLKEPLGRLRGTHAQLQDQPV